MTTAYDSFWEKTAPGLFDIGASIYTRNAGQQEAAGKLGAAQGPLYRQSMGMSKGMLDAAGNFDPQAFAQNRFQAQQNLLDPLYQSQLNGLYRDLYSKGQLGISTYDTAGIDPVTKTQQSWQGGTAVNPQMAAFFAAKNAQKSKDAYASLNEGQGYIDSLLNRSGMLAKQAQGTQSAGLEAQRTLPSRADSMGETFRGVSDILKNPEAMKGIRTGAEWLYGKATGGAPGAAEQAASYGGFDSGAIRSASNAGVFAPAAPPPAPVPVPVAAPPAVADFGFDLGGGLAYDEFGNYSGGVTDYIPPLPADSMEGLYDLGGGLAMDEYGNVFEVASGFDPGAYDFASFDPDGFDLGAYDFGDFDPASFELASLGDDWDWGGWW